MVNESELDSAQCLALMHVPCISTSYRTMQLRASCLAKVAISRHPRSASITGFARRSCHKYSDCQARERAVTRTVMSRQERALVSAGPCLFCSDLREADSCRVHARVVTLDVCTEA